MSPPPTPETFCISLALLIFQQWAVVHCACMLCHSPQYSFNILCDSIQFASLAQHTKQCITKSLHPHAAPPATPSSFPPPCCFKTSKVRLITILRGDKWLREVCSLLWNPCHGLQQRLDIVIFFSSHPWTLIVQRLAMGFDVPKRLERAPVFPHNWMIFAFILLMEAFLEKEEAQRRCYMHHY